MPRYKVVKQGFMGGELYHPDGKRNEVTVDAPFKKCPSWLTPIKEESESQRKKREKAAAKQAEADAKKAAEDKRDTDAVTFTQAPSSAQVETL